MGRSFTRTIQTTVLALLLALGIAAGAQAQDLPQVGSGQFCAQDAEGSLGQESDGAIMICKTTAEDDRLRWRAATDAEIEAAQPATEEAAEEPDEPAASTEETDDMAAPTAVDAGSGGLVADGGLPALVTALMALGALLLLAGGLAIRQR